MEKVLRNSGGLLPAKQSCNDRSWLKVKLSLLPVPWLQLCCCWHCWQLSPQLAACPAQPAAAVRRQAPAAAATQRWKTLDRTSEVSWRGEVVWGPNSPVNATCTR